MESQDIFKWVLLLFCIIVVLNITIALIFGLAEKLRDLTYNLKAEIYANPRRLKSRSKFSLLCIIGQHKWEVIKDIGGHKKENCSRCEAQSLRPGSNHDQFAHWTNWTQIYCRKERTCKICHHVEFTRGDNYENHLWSSWEADNPCREERRCKYCPSVEVRQTGDHDWSEWVHEDWHPTTTIWYQRCSKCGETREPPEPEP